MRLPRQQSCLAKTIRGGSGAHHAEKGKGRGRAPTYHKCHVHYEVKGLPNRTYPQMKTTSTPEINTYPIKRPVKLQVSHQLCIILPSGFIALACGAVGENSVVPLGYVQQVSCWIIIATCRIIRIYLRIPIWSATTDCTFNTGSTHSHHDIMQLRCLGFTFSTTYEPGYVGNGDRSNYTQYGNHHQQFNQCEALLSTVQALK